jgi:CheY-like chemotaxis protein
MHRQDGTLPIVKVLGCIHDLMFSTRLRDAAKDLGHECDIVRKAADVPDRLAGADLVVIDLMVAGGGALEALAAAQQAGVVVVAYGEHVQADVLAAAREAGADQVLTRSEFAYRLPVLLGGEPRRAGH